MINYQVLKLYPSPLFYAWNHLPFPPAKADVVLLDILTTLLDFLDELAGLVLATTKDVGRANIVAQNSQ